MSAQPVDLPTRPSLKPGQVMLAGKVGARRKISTQDGPRFLTLLKLPAPDQYSSPSTVEVESVESLGQQDDEFRGVFAVRGFPRNFDTKDENGEKRKVYTATNVLTYVG